MSAKAVVISESVATPDEDVVIEALGRHGMNVSAMADELGVPSAELRKLLWARPKFVAAADEMVERRLDMGEANIFEAARGTNAKLRFLAGCFITRYCTKARRRGWHTNAPVEAAALVAEPRNFTIRWANSDGSIAPPQPTETITRDGKLLEVRTYEPRSDESVSEHLRIDGPAEISDTDVEQELDNVHALQPLIGEDRDRVEAALRHRPGDRDVILSTVEANGFDISGL
jgi:hypothetical protein